MFVWVRVHVRKCVLACLFMRVCVRVRASVCVVLTVVVAGEGIHPFILPIYITQVCKALWDHTWNTPILL